jgi:polyhydroxybutyrate depolymerase
MKLRKISFLLLPLLLASLAGLPLISSAEDGPLRQRVKDRLQEKQQGKTGRRDITDISKRGDYTLTIRHDGLNRMFLVHVPAKYDPTMPAPMLFAFHGGGGSMNYQADDRRYGLITKSDQEGFIAVFPNGISKLKNGMLATWNAGNCCGSARDHNVDDVGFVRRIIETVTEQLNVDRRRIFAIGMSNGGMMAYRLACEMPDMFRAVASVAGTDNTRECSPKSPVAVLHIHAKNDSHVLFNGGAGDTFRDPSLVTDFTSVPASISKWVKLNECSASSQRVLDKQGAYCNLYSSCRDGAGVQLCVTDTGGHSWPGGSKSRGESPSQALSANDAMWEFFKRH